MKYNLTSNLIFFIPVMKVKYIYKCTAIFYFKQMGLFLVGQGMWGLRDCAVWFAERGFIPSQRPGDLLLASIFCWNYFLHTKQINGTLTFCYYNRYPPPKVTTRFPVVTISLGVMDKKRIKTKISGGVCCKGKFWRYVWGNKGGGNQEYE